ncbi:MAG: deoxyribose-phosphate aldolase [Peptoniphilaceae bacterium]|nr:deoxyribose-phosphate aldolase [Peptoniphilaceae bacterium]MDY6085668.1 deoxyribose-phosphate aldolase [Peptoniphilaceae bacterium]
MEINRMIDHTLLKPEATPEQIEQLCREARDYHFCSCCVNTAYVPQVHAALEGSDVKTCCVVGFPLGAMSTAAKAFEARQAIADGADEVDMVLHVGALKSGDDDYVKQDIQAVKDVCGERVLKVILETCLLTDEEKKRACELAVAAGADFVKTSTGFSTGGATVEDVRLMKETVGERAQVKASGGIHTTAEALAMIEAGASRIGASAGIQIVEGTKEI